jgi:hypothetical protein
MQGGFGHPPSITIAVRPRSEVNIRLSFGRLSEIYLVSANACRSGVAATPVRSTSRDRNRWLCVFLAHDPRTTLRLNIRASAELSPALSRLPVVAQTNLIFRLLARSGPTIRRDAPPFPPHHRGECNESDAWGFHDQGHLVHSTAVVEPISLAGSLTSTTRSLSRTASEWRCRLTAVPSAQEMQLPRIEEWNAPNGVALERRRADLRPQLSREGKNALPLGSEPWRDGRVGVG